MNRFLSVLLRSVCTSDYKVKDNKIICMIHFVPSTAHCPERRSVGTSKPPHSCFTHPLPRAGFPLSPTPVPVSYDQYRRDSILGETHLHSTLQQRRHLQCSTFPVQTPHRRGHREQVSNSKLILGIFSTTLECTVIFTKYVNPVIA